MSAPTNNGPYVAVDGTMGGLWTVVVRVWDAPTTAWRGVATLGVIASSADHAIKLTAMNGGDGGWPEGADFRAYPPGTGPGKLVWGDAATDDAQQGGER
jgi:hypothetical protein